MIESDLWDQARGDTIPWKKVNLLWTRWNGSYSERVEGTNILCLREESESLVLIKK